jgi:hypothetical protein
MHIGLIHSATMIVRLRNGFDRYERSQLDEAIPDVFRFERKWYPDVRPSCCVETIDGPVTCWSFQAASAKTGIG